MFYAIVFINYLIDKTYTDQQTPDNQSINPKYYYSYASFSILFNYPTLNKYQSAETIPDIFSTEAKVLKQAIMKSPPILVARCIILPCGNVLDKSFRQCLSLVAGR